MKIIRFRRLDGIHTLTGKAILEGVYEIALSQEHLNAKLNGAVAMVIMPAKPWYVRLCRLMFPLQGIDVPADGVTREVKLR